MFICDVSYHNDILSSIKEFLHYRSNKTKNSEEKYWGSPSSIEKFKKLFR